MSTTTQSTQQTIGLGKAFGLLLSSIASVIMFIPRLVASANKLVDITDDILDSGKNMSETMKQTSEDFKNTSALEAEATYQQRLEEINKNRQEQGLGAVKLGSSRTLSPAAQAALDQLKVK